MATVTPDREVTSVDIRGAASGLRLPIATAGTAAKREELERVRLDLLSLADAAWLRENGCAL